MGFDVQGALEMPARALALRAYRAEVIPSLGSDHLPVFGAFCLSPDTDGAAEPKPDATEKRQAEDAIRDVEGTGPPEKELPVKTNAKHL